MKGGFSFCGHDIAEFGLEYAPENEYTYVYAPTEAEMHTETFDGHHGGYFYGATKKPKEFSLRCFFEDNQIDRGIMTRIYNFFHVGKSGKLIFQRKPWCYYYATVTDNPKLEITNYLNGTVTITMQAAYPFARGESTSPTEETEAERNLHVFYCGIKDLYHDDVMLNTALFETRAMAAALPLSYTNITSAKTIYLANPGTERAHVGIIARGNAGTGINIANKTTNQLCRIVAMSKAVTTSASKEVFIDGINGKTMLRDTSTKIGDIAFLYHDQGYIELEPCFPAIRNVFIDYTASTKITVANIINEEIVGKFIFANNKWRKIVAYSDHTITVAATDVLEAAGSEKTMITALNEIYISPVSTMTIDKIGFSYKPTFA